MEHVGYVVRKLMGEEEDQAAAQDADTREVAPTGAPAGVTGGGKGGGTVLNQLGDKIMDELHKLPCEYLYLCHYCW